ncbi:HYDIN [Symbiodinium sp. CCMP2592]|nr:HYDIN [Symbiodinium sp. CCMP2592]
MSTLQSQGSRSGAQSARGPTPKRIPLSGYGAPLSARGTSSDRVPPSKMLQLGSSTLAPASSSSCLKRKPSEVIAAARQPGGLTAPSRSQLDNMTCRIVAFQDMGDYTHQVDSVVPVEEPLFKATPPEIRFANFESLQNLDATLCLRNQDNVVKILHLGSMEEAGFNCRKINGDGDNKVAPGMEVSYTVRFTPDQQVEDYSYDLVVVTERERFIVPIRASGCSALLDMPDELDFGVSPVKFESPKTIMVRNVGEKATKFLLKVPPPFSTSIQDGYLEVGEIMQVDVVFRPDKAEQYEPSPHKRRDLLILYGDGIEAYMALKGKAENVSVTFSANQLQMEDTFIALSTQKTIVIHNNSEIPVDFSWRAFPSIQEEIGQKLKLQVQLKQEESDEAAALQELSSMGEDSDEESQLSESSDEYMTKCSSLKGVELAHGALQRRYKNIAKAILEDPMFFYDEIFAVEPLSGRIWAKSKVAITFTFTPKAALNYQCLAYCSIVGRAERLPLLLKGIGIGPKAAFSYDELDVGDIFVESVHQYEVNLINQGDIDVEFRLVPNTSPFGSKFAFTPSDGRLEVGGQCTIVVEVCPDLLGEFQETFYWELVGSTSKIALGFRGHSVSPTFHFDLDRISFGVVSYGFLNSKTLTLTNTSDQGAWNALPAARGDYVELKLLDASHHPQGMGESPMRYGEWFTGTIIAVSDGYLQWWLDEGEGSAEQRWFSFHVCAKTPATCRVSKGRPDMEFHFERRAKEPRAREKASGPAAEAEAALEKKRRRWLASVSSDSSFREASSSRDRQLQLLEYSERDPGRLAARLLQKMRTLLARDGGALNFAARGDPAPPVATSYLLTILVPEYRAKVGVPLLRELKTLCKTLDLVVEGEARRAADLLAQRVKAIEASLADDHWLKAQFLELVPREGSLHGDRRGGDGGPPASPGDQGEGSRATVLGHARADESEPPPLRTSTPEGEKGKKGEGKKGEKGKKGRKYSPPRRRKAFGVSEDEDTLRDSLEHAAKHAAVPYLGSFFRRMEETEAAPPGAEPTREQDLLPIHVDATCNIEVVENCSQLVLETTLHTLNFHYCCGWISPVCWPPPEEITPRQAEAVKGIVKACAGCLGRGLPLGGPAEAEKILSSRSRDYEGNMVERVGEIQADLVIAAWPKVGEAAVASVTDFLTGDALQAVLSPRPHFKRGSDQPRTSKKGRLHATQEEWNKVVAAAFQRNMMGPVPRDAQGHLITNGAGAVEKRKLVGGKEVAMQRFISNFVPINEYLEALPGDQDFLPYVAQLGLLLLEDNQTLMIEPEDLTSAFNLFRMPDAWLPYFSYAKKVPGHILGSNEVWVRPGLRVIPMGWSSAVTIMQAVLRNLVFTKAGVPESLEISKVKEIPAEGGAVLYLDSFDQVRMVDTTLRAVEEGVASPEHERFRAACLERGFPLNASKSLAGALRGGIQGGVLDGDKGLFQWEATKLWVGIATLVAAFRRPLFAVFQEIFPLIERAKEGAVDPDPQVIDQMLTFVLLLPLASTSLRARVSGEISCSDASLWGGGAAVAQTARRPTVAAVEEDEVGVCARCGGVESWARALLPLPRFMWEVLLLHLVHCQPLTEAMALNKVAVLTALGPNVNDKDDFWSAAGKEKLERGEQAQLQNGRWVDAAAFEVRRANTLALRALKSLSRAVEENSLCYVCQPWGSYLWYLPEAEELRETKGIFSTSFPLCCFGGPKRWVELLHNSPAVHQALHRTECREHEEEPKAWYDNTGRIRFACCEELRLPEDLCDTLALAIRKDLAEICPLIPGKLTDRTIAAAEAAAEVIAPIAREILENPIEHLRRMLSRGHYRGTEVRLMAPGEPDNLKLVPYPAHLWRWRNTLSFAWHNEDNITALEMLAALAEIRRQSLLLTGGGALSCQETAGPRGPPGFSPVLWFVHGALIMTAASVPMRFALRIPGDGRSNQREFDVIPPKGTLLPNCSQKIQIDFVSLNVKSYDLCLVVDLDGVGQELASIPIQARCAVPQVALEPSEHLEYGDIFIRYPSHQTLVLNNTSALPAKFQIMPQDDSTRSIAEFEPDQSFGSVPPASSHVLTFTLTSQVIGTLQIPITIRILGHNSANTVILIANTIGPIVNIEPSVVDWGNSHCLEPITRSVLVSNNSVIPASDAWQQQLFTPNPVRCIMKTRNSLWTLSPKAMELQPHESAYLYMTLTIDEVAKMTDIAHVIVHESNDVAVTVRAKGIGTPVTCKESLELIDFGTQYTTQTHSREVVIENRGRQPRKLVWTLESEETKKKDRKTPTKDKPAEEGTLRKPRFELCALRACLSAPSASVAHRPGRAGESSSQLSHGSALAMPKPPAGRDWIDSVDDTFDTLARPGARPSRPSQASPPRPSRHSRHSRKSNDSPKSQRVSERSLQPARVQADSYQDWRQAQEEAARAIRAVEPSKRKKTRFYSRLRVCVVVCFVAGYIALVAVLVSAILSERSELGETGEPECEKLCPLNTRCRMEEGEARCVALPGSNLETMELILWIVVGLPSLICIPCLFQWLLRRCCPKCWEKMAKSRWGSAAFEAYQADTEALGAMLGKPQPETSETSETPAPAVAEARSSKEDPPGQGHSQGHTAAIPVEDGLNDLFAPLAKSRPPKASAAEEEELDLLFARKPKPKEPEEVVPVRGPPKPPSTDLESAFSHLFHKRARLLPKPQPKSAAVSTPGSALHSDFSAGMSVLFANVQSSKAKQTWDARNDPDPQSQSTVIEASRVHSEAPAGVGDFLDQDLGDPPDFFAFAKLVAGSVDTARSHLHDSDAASDSGDSLGHLEPSDLLDLFHPTLDGKCAFRFVFNASSPKPGSLSDTLVCTELCGNDRKGNAIYKTELRGNFVLPLLELSATSVSFRYLWERNCPLHPLSEPLVLKNISPLELELSAAIVVPDGCVHQFRSWQLNAALFLAVSVSVRNGLALMLPGGVKLPPPAPLAMRQRTTKLRDPETGFRRPPPKEADFALDIFQRTFPRVNTEEHILIRRWEDMVDIFESPELVNQLIEDEPSILRMPRRTARNALHLLSIYLGEEAAKEAVFECPYLLTKNSKLMRATLPALINVLGSRSRLREVIAKYPQLTNLPVGDFYKAMGDMTAVMGSTEAAMAVAKEAMDRVARSPYVSAVPGGYPVLIAIFGNLEEAHKAIAQEPLLLKWYGENFLGRLGTLRQLLGKEGAQNAVRKAPYLLLEENQRKSRKFELAFEAVENLFGTEEARQIVGDRPELLALGWKLHRALRFAERRLGSREKVRDRFDAILERTGLAEHLNWERKQRPRNGLWTPKLRMHNGYPLNHGPWSPYTNPLGKGGPARGPWQDFTEDEEKEEDNVEEKVRFFIKVQPPFYVNIDTCYLRSGETLEIRVEFDPAYKVDRVCGTVKQKLTIVYQDHPQRDHVNLVGEVIFPNLTLSNNKLDFGSVLNETSKQLTITMANPNALPVNFQWSFVEEEMSEDDVSGGQRASVVMQSTANSAANSFSSGFPPKPTASIRSIADPNLEMSSLPRLSQVAEMQGTLLPKQKQRPAVDINQIFDILPIMGVLEPGHTQDVTFTYFGMKNQKFDCLAVCQTEGGPEYEVTLKGQASRLDFRLDKTELDFGEIPYTEVQEREIVLANTGKVAFQFNWNLCALSRPPVLDCWPVSGQINPGDKERITIRFRTGIPDEVNEVALLEVAHFERQRINVRGHGIFPGILLLQGSNPDVFKGLERSNEQEHQTNKELALQRLRENGPPPQAACVSSTSSMHSAEISANESAASLAEWQPEPQVVEFEVDRHFICQSLLAKEKELWEKHLEKCNKESKETFGKGSGRGSARGRGERRPMLEVTHITAAYYECNFGHIVLGHSGKKVISVYNCFHESVSFNINKRLLMQKGFQISPEKAVCAGFPAVRNEMFITFSEGEQTTSWEASEAGAHLLPRQDGCDSTCSLLAAFVSEHLLATGEEGKQELNWIIPVRGGPSYEVKLMSEFVRPDLELSSDSIDFGHVIVGQVKRITIKLRNAKSVMASWDYKAPTAKPGKPMEFAYSLSPRSGRVAPGESQLVTVSFTPTSSRSYNQKVALRIMDNPMRKMLHMRGCGDGLRVNVEPSTTFELGPVLPGTEDCMQELFLCNPTNYTIEVYSVDFDTKYQEEEFFLHVYDKYENNSMEMPVRTPGAPTWPAVAKHGREVRRQQERQRRLQEKARGGNSLAALLTLLAFISSSLALSPERRLKERALRREEATLRAEAARKASEEPPEDPEEAERLGRQKSPKPEGDIRSFSSQSYYVV